MTKVAAIYGFEFTKRFEAGGVLFEPVESDQAQAKARARNIDSHCLSGFVYGDLLSLDFVFCLEAVLSFVERLDVVVLGPFDLDFIGCQPSLYFDPVLNRGSRNAGGGAVIRSDAFGPWSESRPKFIDAILSRLSDDAFCKQTPLRMLLFRSVETFRQRRPAIEISYFLLISGLEAFCRDQQQDFHSNNAAIPIAKMLKEYGFNVFQDNVKCLPRSISTYLHLRNALFHQGKFSKLVKINEYSVYLKCTDYLFHLSMLVSLIIFKVVGFEDKHFNWDCWYDRYPYK